METKRRRLIMVDDDRTNLIVARGMLIDKYDILTVTSGEKLFGLLEKVVPDLILLDIEMPEMNGHEVIKQLKNSERTAHIPVIFLTALNNPGSEDEGLKLGASDYVYKPFSQEVLLESVEKHLPT